MVNPEFKPKQTSKPAKVHDRFGIISALLIWPTVAVLLTMPVAFIAGAVAHMNPGGLGVSTQDLHLIRFLGLSYPLITGFGLWLAWRKKNGRRSLRGILLGFAICAAPAAYYFKQRILF